MPLPEFKLEEIGGAARLSRATVTVDMRHAAHVFISEARSGNGVLASVRTSFNGLLYESGGYNEEYGIIPLRWLPPEQRTTSVPGWLNSKMYVIDRVLERSREINIEQILLPTHYYHRGVWRCLRR